MSFDSMKFKSKPLYKHEYRSLENMNQDRSILLAVLIILAMIIFIINDKASPKIEQAFIKKHSEFKEANKIEGLTKPKLGIKTKWSTCSKWILRRESKRCSKSSTWITFVNM